MAKRVMQIRYYGNTNSNNQPSVLKEDLRTNKEHPLINGEVFDTALTRTEDVLKEKIAFYMLHCYIAKLRR